MTYANPNQRLNNYKTNLNIKIYKTNFWFNAPIICLTFLKQPMKNQSVAIQRNMNYLAPTCVEKAS